MSDSATVGYGLTDLVSIEQIVASTKVRLQLKDDDGSYDKEIELFINEAGAMLGTKPTFRRKNCRIEIDDCGKATLPKGFKKLWGVLPIIDTPAPAVITNSIYYNNLGYDALLYLENTFFSEYSSYFPNGYNVLSTQGIYEKQGNNLMFPIPNYFTHAIISFDGYAISDCGILEMHPAYEQPFREYARAMMLDTYNFLWKGEPQLLSQSIARSFQMWSSGYHVLVGGAFADDFENNSYMIKRILRSLLGSQNNFNSH